MSREEELKLLYRARDLISDLTQKRIACSSLEKQLEAKQSEQPPEPPVLQHLQQPAPPTIVPTTKFNKWIAFLPFGISIVLVSASFIFFTLPMLCIAWIFIYYFAIYSKQQENEIKNTQNSPAYQQQYQVMLQEYQRQQESANQQFAEEKTIYEQQTLPQFEATRQQAIEELNQQLVAAQSEFEIAKKKFDDFRTNERGIIPEKYIREKTPMYINHLIQYMEDSDISLEEAIKKEEDRTTFDFYQHQVVEQRQYRQQYYDDSDYYDYEEPSRSSGGHGFVRDVAAVAVGTAIGNGLSDRHRKKQQSKEINWRYTCGINCPNQEKYSGKCRLGLDPKTCGRGINY